MTNKQKTKPTYVRTPASGHHASFFPNYLIQRRHIAVRECLMKYGKDAKLVLDVGCGSAPYFDNTKITMIKSFLVVGLDLNRPNLEKA